jgi:hypothetical protein
MNTHSAAKPGPCGITAFNEAVHHARQALIHRAYAAMIRRGCSVYGWTPGAASAVARRHEREVRRLADQSIAARATGEAA